MEQATLELFTPILNGERQKFENVKIIEGDPLSRIRGYRGVVETQSGERFKVYGISCGLPRCMCDARIVKANA